MVGCPYGQELELITTGVTPWGQDFFWTIAKPLATFQPDDEIISVATEEWKRYLQEGTLSQGQVNARSAKYANEFLQLIKGN